MTEEEKKTFNFLKTFVKTEIDYCKLKKADVLDILNIIEKLQKENEELKLKDYYLPAWVTKKYVSKDKIRKLFKKYNININEEEITVDGLDALTFIEEIDELLEEG